MTQATFVKQLLPLVCKNPDAVRDRIKRGEKPNPSEPENASCVFWRFFAEDKDWAILRILTNYFAAVAEVFGDAWTSDDSPLGRTIGFSALMRLLDRLAQKGLATKPEARLDGEFFRTELEKAKGLAPFSFDAYSPSGVGETKLFKALEAAVFASSATLGGADFPAKPM